MPKYLNLVRGPLADQGHLASARSMHASRAFFVALESEVIELASDLLETGRVVQVTSTEGAVRLEFKERGPSLMFILKDRSVTRHWTNVGLVMARADEIAPVPVPADTKDYEREAAEVIASLMPTVNTLLEK